MADDTEYDIDPGEGIVEPPTTAIGLAMNAADRDGGVAQDARHFLRRQSHYLDLQMEDLHEQRDLTLSHMRWRRFNDRMKAALQLLVFAGGALIAIAIAAVVWTAANDHSLIVESFSVPPDVAAHGETGPVVAAHVMDRISTMENEVTSFRAKSSYQNNWENNIHLNIPDTGISVSEAYGFLVGWIGHQTHITGEVVRTASGYALTARVSGGTSGTFEGPALEPLAGKAAEHILNETQPYLYGVWLGFKHRDPESNTVFLTVARSRAAPAERAWAFSALISPQVFAGDYAAADRNAREALRLQPDLAFAWSNIALAEDVRGHDEAACKARQKLLDLLNGSAGAEVSAELRESAEMSNRMEIARCSGDFTAAIAMGTQYLDDLGLTNSRRTAAVWGVADNLIRIYDLHAARVLLAQVPFAPNPRRGAAQYNLAQRELIWTEMAVARGDWRGAAALRDAADKRLKGFDFARIKPAALQAYARAMLGDFPGAHALIETTPRDCYLCLRMRGAIRAAEKRWDAAAYWYAEAARRAPSLPFADTEWGQMELTRGDPSAAIALCKTANERGPHFTDPLELWGEALVAQKRSDLALARFAEAGHLAPNWGRLHLKWGEALWWLGRKDDARKQFAAAALLDLTPEEKRQLAVWQSRR